MQKYDIPYSSLLSLLGLITPTITQAATYDSDGAVLLGAEIDGSDNLIAAIGGSGLSLTCLATVILMLVSIYIFHEIWHPKRVHEEMTDEEIKQGTIKFYIGGTFVWMLVAIMAESWCLLLPLTAILSAVLIYYVVTISSITERDLAKRLNENQD